MDKKKGRSQLELLFDELHRADLMKERRKQVRKLKKRRKKERKNGPAADDSFIDEDDAEVLYPSLHSSSHSDFLNIIFCFRRKTIILMIRKMKMTATKLTKTRS